MSQRSKLDQMIEGAIAAGRGYRPAPLPTACTTCGADLEKGQLALCLSCTAARWKKEHPEQVDQLMGGLGLDEESVALLEDMFEDSDI